MHKQINECVITITIMFTEYLVSVIVQNVFGHISIFVKVSNVPSPAGGCWRTAVSKVFTMIELTFCGKDSEQGIVKCQTVVRATKKKIRQSKRIKNSLEGDRRALSDRHSLGRPL